MAYSPMQLIDTTDLFPFVAGPREGGLDAKNPQHIEIVRLGLERALRRGKRVLSISGRVRRGVACGFCICSTGRQERLQTWTSQCHRYTCFDIRIMMR